MSTSLAHLVRVRVRVRVRVPNPNPNPNPNPDPNQAAEEVGLDTAAAASYLASDEGFEEVRESVASLQRAGVRSIPIFAFKVGLGLGLRLGLGLGLGLGQGPILR